jgi:hypothetical protein
MMKDYLENPFILPLLAIFTILVLRTTQGQKAPYLNESNLMNNSIENLVDGADNFFKN